LSIAAAKFFDFSHHTLMSACHPAEPVAFGLADCRFGGISAHSAQVGALNDALNRAAGTTVELHVRSVIAAEVTREGMLYAPDFDLPEPK
jgi:hypothetical protein